MSQSDPDDLDDDEPILWGPAPIGVYAAMLGATLAGQLVGIVIDAVIGSRGFAVPVACSVILEAIVGPRFTAARIGRALTVAENARLSAYYSAALLAVSIALAIWFDAARPRDIGRMPGLTPGNLGVVALVLALATVVRWGIMIALRPRRA